MRTKNDHYDYPSERKKKQARSVHGMGEKPA
jgi:hypothetical protein